MHKLLLKNFKWFWECAREWRKKIMVPVGGTLVTSPTTTSSFSLANRTSIFFRYSTLRGNGLHCQFRRKVLVNKPMMVFPLPLVSLWLRSRHLTQIWAMRPEGRSSGSSYEGFSHFWEGDTRRVALFPLLLLLHLDVMAGAAAAIWNMKEASIRVKVTMAELKREESRYSMTPLGLWSDQPTAVLLLKFL